VALGQVFSGWFGFPLSIFIPPIAPQSPSSIVCGWYNRPVVAAIPSGLSLTPLRIKKKVEVRAKIQILLELPLKIPVPEVTHVLENCAPRRLPCCVNYKL
jgi:hypothetical protein